MVNLFRLLFRYLWVILLITIIAGAAGFYVSYFMTVDSYTAQSTLYVMMPEPEGKSTTYTDIVGSGMIIFDINELSKTGSLLLDVQKKLAADIPAFKNLTYEEMLEKVSIVVKSETRIVNIKVTDPDPTAAAMLAGKIATALKEKFAVMLKMDAIQIVDPGLVPNSPSNASPMRNTLLAVLGGLLLSLGIILFVDRIRSELDAEQAAFAPARQGEVYKPLKADLSDASSGARDYTSPLPKEHSIHSPAGQ